MDYIKYCKNFSENMYINMIWRSKTSLNNNRVGIVLVEAYNSIQPLLIEPLKESRLSSSEFYRNLGLSTHMKYLEDRIDEVFSVVGLQKRFYNQQEVSVSYSTIAKTICLIGVYSRLYSLLALDISKDSPELNTVLIKNLCLILKDFNYTDLEADDSNVVILYRLANVLKEFLTGGYITKMGSR